MALAGICNLTPTLLSKGAARVDSSGVAYLLNKALNLGITDYIIGNIGLIEGIEGIEGIGGGEGIE